MLVTPRRGGPELGLAAVTKQENREHELRLTQPYIPRRPNCFGSLCQSGATLT
jgi:hypothetical protein